MATRVEVFELVTPAADVAAQICNFGQDFGAVTKIEVVFPDGCASLLQVIVLFGEQQVIPYQAGASLVGNNENVVFDELDDYPPGNSWSIGANNLDFAYAHTATIKFFIDTLIVPNLQPLPSILLLPLGV